jgi:hypothetical protein
MLYSFDGSLARARAQFAAMRAIARAMESDLFVARPEVSGWSAGEHLDHLAKVSNGIAQLILRNKPVEARPLNLLGRAVLATGWIPRGRARSPEPLRGAVSTLEELEGLFSSGEELLRRLEDAPARATRHLLTRHPYFGALDARHSIRFVSVHIHHHLKIVDEIARAARRSVSWKS